MNWTKSILVNHRRQWSCSSPAIYRWLCQRSTISLVPARSPTRCILFVVHWLEKGKWWKKTKYDYWDWNVYSTGWLLMKMVLEYSYTNREECWCRHSFLASNIHLYVEEEIRAYAGPFVIKFRLSLYHCPAVINIYNPCWCIYKGMGRMKSGSN